MWLDSLQEVLVLAQNTCLAKDWWFDQLTTNGLRLTTNGLSPFALSLSKGTLIARQVS
jgi:hypothetical protein